MKKRSFLAGLLAMGLVLTVPVNVGATNIIDSLTEVDETTTTTTPTTNTTTNTTTTTTTTTTDNTTTGTATTTTTAGPTDTSSTKDTTLSSLSIKPGTLSPAFSPSVYEYTAWVDASTTHLSVGATPNDSEAVIAYVSGRDLTPGENTVTVCCSATDYSTTLYTIKVTCGGTEPAGTDTPVVTDTAGETDVTDETGIAGTITLDDEVDGEDVNVDVTEVTTSSSGKKKTSVTFDDDGYLIYAGERYVPLSEAGGSISQDKYNSIYDELQEAKSQKTSILIALIVTALILGILTVNMWLKYKDLKADFDDSIPKAPKGKEEKVKASKASEKRVAEKKEPEKKTTAKKETAKKTTEKKPVEKAKPRKKPAEDAYADDDDIEIFDFNKL